MVSAFYFLPSFIIFSFIIIFFFLFFSATILPCHKHSENVCHPVVYKNRTPYTRTDIASNQSKNGEKMPFPVSYLLYVVYVYFLSYCPRAPLRRCHRRAAPPLARHTQKTREIINRTPVTDQIQITICNIRFTLVVCIGPRAFDPPKRGTGFVSLIAHTNRRRRFKEKLTYMRVFIYLFIIFSPFIFVHSFFIVSSK